MGMSWCKCPFLGMPWCKCSEPDTNYSKIPFIFKMRFLQRLKPKYFQNLIYYSWKVIFFLLKAPKKLVITVRNLWMGHWLRIWWSGSKDLFSQFGWAKRGGMFSRLFSGKTNFLKIKHFKRTHFFLVSEHGNLTGVKANRDRLKNLGEGILE